MTKLRNWVNQHSIGIVFGNGALLLLLAFLHRFAERIGFPEQLLAALTVFACVYFVFWGILLPVIGIRRFRKSQAVSNPETMQEIQDFLHLVILPPLMAISVFFLC